MSKSSSRTKKTVILEGFNPNSPLVTDDMALNYLAQLTVEIYLDIKEYEYFESQKHIKESRNILSSINEGAS